MKKTTAITIGIAAHNEERNIYSLLTQIFAQKMDVWKLHEVIIYTDACNDNTIAEIKRFNNKKIIIVDGKKHKGKCFGINTIFSKAKGEIIVLFDADIKIANTSVISYLINPLLTNTQIAVTGGNTRPFSPKTFFQRAVYSTFIVFDQSRKYKNNGNNIFGCNGASIGIRAAFAKSIHLPNIINDDDFIYFSCLKSGYLFKHVRQAIVYYKLPTRLSDYTKQIFRSNPQAVSINISSYFGGLVEKEYARPLSLYASSIFYSFKMLPLETLFIVGVNLLAKPFYLLVTSNYKLSWHTAQTTK